MQKDNLLNELKRQEKYLAEIPADFTFPLFNTKRALDFQRQNGYRNTAVAAREIVDNSFEAQASKARVIFETTRVRGITGLWRCGKQRTLPTSPQPRLLRRRARLISKPKPGNSSYRWMRRMGQVTTFRRPDSSERAF
ncbi:MAG: hypothetical protein ABR905_12590 [Terracidiphilus sp.]